MFFRRERPKPLSFEQRLENLRQAGFTVEKQPNGRTKISRNCCAAVLENTSDGLPHLVEHPGIVWGAEIASLVDGGFQKFFQTPAGQCKPALASDLKSLHAFTEDLREALGLVSLYNESLGTVSKYYLYDRVQDRGSRVHKRAWEN